MVHATDPGDDAASAAGSKGGAQGPEPAAGRRERVISHEEAVAAARRAFLAHGVLDMRALADELAVGRATLYRVVGNRDALLGEVLWQLGQRTLDRALEATAGEGVERFVEASKRLHQGIVTFQPLRTLLREDPYTAFRVLFTPAGGVHERFVQRWAGIFEQAAAEGELALPMEAPKLAYLFVRIGESMLYADVFAGQEPDIELAAVVRRALFRLA